MFLRVLHREVNKISRLGSLISKQPKKKKYRNEKKERIYLVAGFSLAYPTIKIKKKKEIYTWSQLV